MISKMPFGKTGHQSSRTIFGSVSIGRLNQSEADRALDLLWKYDVNHEGSGDMYPKGANMLHTFRQLVNNDSTWRAMLRGLNEEFFHQTVTTEQIENYMADFTGLNLSSFFDQYTQAVPFPGDCPDGFHSYAGQSDAPSAGRPS